MAKYLKTPAKWYRDLVAKRRAFEADEEFLEAAKIEQKILLELDYLNQSIKLLREYADGYSAAEGYSLKKLTLIPDKQLAKVRRYAPLIREELATPHVTVRARSESARVALETHTGQRGIPKRKKFIVHVERPESTRVRLVESRRSDSNQKKTRKGAPTKIVEISSEIGGVTFHERLYLLPEQPESFAHIVTLTRRLLRFMPKGWYVMVTSNHGNISAPMRKEDILNRLHEDFMGYDVLHVHGKDNRALAEVVIGYKYISQHSSDAMREYQERLTNRERLDRYRRAQRLTRRRDVLIKRGIRK